jgi:arsenite methyltransferase
MLASIIASWDVFLTGSPHPWAPPLSTVLEKRFTPEERQFFEQIMRPIVESPEAVTTARMVYLNAAKPVARTPPSLQGSHDDHK